MQFNLPLSHCFGSIYHRPAKDHRTLFDIYHQQQCHRPIYLLLHHYVLPKTCVRLQYGFVDPEIVVLWNNH